MILLTIASFASALVDADPILRLDIGMSCDSAIADVVDYGAENHKEIIPGWAEFSYVYVGYSSNLLLKCQDNKLVNVSIRSQYKEEDSAALVYRTQKQYLVSALGIPTVDADYQVELHHAIGLTPYTSNWETDALKVGIMASKIDGDWIVYVGKER